MSLVVVRVAGLATVQDLGRRGHMHEAVPPGGVLVRELAIAANRAAGNPDDDAVIEVFGRISVRAEAAIEIAAAGTVQLSRPGRQTAAGIQVGRAGDGEAQAGDVARHGALTAAGARWYAKPLALDAGAELVITSEPRRVAYLAIRGGVDAPVMLGGRGALLAAGLGAPLRANDRIAAAAPLRADDRERGPGEPHARTGLADPAANLSGDAPIRVLPGPDLAAFAPRALEILESAPYRILPTSDRVGTRLDGPRIPRVPGGETSRPMVHGAIEVPGDGAPIVLGPDFPTTGGYPILAVVATADLGRFFATRFGGSMRFAR